MKRQPYGPNAWFVDDISSPVAWAETLTTMYVPGIEAIIPAEATVVVRCTRSRHEAIGRVLDIVVPAETVSNPMEPLIIDVVYGGPDLVELATQARMRIHDVVQVHVTGTYEVAFCGFSPGFGYLRGLDERLHVPRRDTPRLSVPAGAVGIAAGYTCVYPAASPGGWHLIGQTVAPLWDVERDPPALLQPGRVVRFRSVAP